MPEDTVEATPPEAVDTWQIEVDHNSYYRWVPIADADVIDERLPSSEPPEEGVTEVEIEYPVLGEGQVWRKHTIDSTFPGFRMRQVTVDEPTTTTTGVHVPSLAQENTDRAAIGLAPRPLHALLTRALEDGAWPRHFPMQSITAIRCSDPGVQAKLRSYFLEDK